MPYHYSAFGLSIAADRRIPALTVTAPRPLIDTHITLGDDPSHVDPELLDAWYTSDLQEDGAPALRVWRSRDGSQFRMLYCDGTEFLVDRAGTKVSAHWPPSSTIADTSTYLLGPVLGFVLRLRGIACLHASAVVVGNCAIALMGGAGAGKSTTAASLGQAGHPVLTDDIVALREDEEGVSVQPGYPQLRLWPDSVALLYGNEDALPRLTPTWDKRALDLTLPGHRFRSTSVPLASVYLLDDLASDRRDALGGHGEPRIEQLSGAASLVALLGNTYAGYLLDARMQRQQFATLAHLASHVPVRRVFACGGAARAAQLRSLILHDCEACRV